MLRQGSSASAVGSRHPVLVGAAGLVLARQPLVSARTLKMVAIGYAVKSLLVGLAWVAVPDLPERTVAKARDAWEWIAGHP